MNNSNLIAFRLDERENRALREAARRAGISVSDYIRRALQEKQDKEQV
jgi:predicted HicB family RNase H-like nuclease